MAIDDYRKAYQAGKKDYQARMMRGERPTLQVLDELLPPENLTTVSLGLVQIPIDQIVGTRYEGRATSFSGSFMPILEDNTEFAQKWANLSTAHMEEGIHDPIKAWEYRNRFYVEEGNKRVSVMKYYQAVSIPGTVTRVLPKRTDDKETVIYYEFVDFYNLSKINYIEFSREGSFAKLQAAVGKKPDEAWDDDDRLNFSSVYTRFTAAFTAKGGKKLPIKPGDAFLSFITLYGYQEVSDITTDEMKTLVAKAWEEFTLLGEAETVSLKMDPTTEKKPLLSRLLTKTPSRLKIAFIYDKTPGSSAWTYSHELGRLHLEQTFPEEVSTIAYSGITAETISDCLEKAIAQGCNLIFTTTPVFAAASVKAAIANPDVRILNCSLNTSHRYIRTYYARMHEAKFLMGAIAGAMAENNRLTYIADYPLFGTISNINAFALGAKMINPRAKVYLEWSSKKDVDIDDEIRRLHPSCISGKDMVIPEEASRLFGIYHIVDGRPQNLAMPLCHWGRFYEKLIRTIMDGTWKYDDTGKAINYWWGMSSGVVDVICSQNLPIGTKRLVELLRHTISAGEFNPFSGILYSQAGVVKSHWEGDLSPEQIVKMDWLAENVVGSIPEEYELTEQAKPVVAQQGVKKSPASLT
ncbi:MAG: BMP family ABC transporter substrate-binding protein [Lachnospiraceae bacterium]|nr:BMP family ABC transporter substrate-binding protein [Lachnospiraceae bacterium]